MDTVNDTTALLNFFIQSSINKNNDNSTDSNNNNCMLENSHNNLNRSLSVSCSMRNGIFFDSKSVYVKNQICLNTLTFIENVTKSKYQQTKHHPLLYAWQNRTLSFMEQMETHTGPLTVELPLNYVHSKNGEFCKVLENECFIQDTTVFFNDMYHCGHLLFPPMQLQVVSDATGGIIASDVGTGKTAIILQHIANKLEIAIKKTLIIVPTTLEGQWVSEMQRVWGDKYMEAPKHASGEKRKLQSPDDSKLHSNSNGAFDGKIRVWRCNTISKYKNYPSNWNVMLITFSFLRARMKELMDENSELYFRHLTPDIAMKACMENGMPTLFYDIDWGHIILDEVETENNSSQISMYMWSFINNIPTQHVWLITATPVDFTFLASLLRLRLVNVENKNGNITDMVLACGIDWQTSIICQHLTFRVGKEETFMHNKFVIKPNIVELTLSNEEDAIIEYLKLSGKWDYKSMNSAILCTDVHTFLQNFRADKNIPVVTIDDFWCQMRFENCQDGQLVSDCLQRIKNRLDELHSILDALPNNDEQRHAVIQQIKNKEASFERAKLKQNKVESSSTFLNNLKQRVKEDAKNPCSICLLPIQIGMLAITPCGHSFCILCMTAWLKTNNMCPTCRKRPIQLEDVTVISGVVDADAQPVQNETKMYSTKIDFMLTHLRYIFTTTQDKIIIFTNYPQTMQKIKEVLQHEGIQVAVMTGNVNSKSKNLIQFKTPTDECRVMLLNTITQNAGLDLIQANHIIFMDVDGNQLTSTDFVQACGRIARLGQKKEIFLHFLHVPAHENKSAISEYIRLLNIV